MCSLPPGGPHHRRMDALLTFPAGLVAGLAIAVPVGAIGVLLIHEGVARGFRAGLPAAVAVASVDTVYCAVAVLVGAIAAPVVGGWAPWPQRVGGAVLAAIGVGGLLRSRGARVPAVVGSAPAVPAPRGVSPRARFGLFLALTAINPATLLYFVAILPGLHDLATSIPAQIAFVAGVTVASFGWQAALVAGGAFLRRIGGPRLRVWTTVVGNGVVILLGIALIAAV